MTNVLLTLAACYLLIALLCAGMTFKLIGRRAFLFGMIWPYVMVMGFFDGIDWYSLAWERRNDSEQPSDPR